MEGSMYRNRTTPVRAALATLFALLACGLFAASAQATTTPDPFDNTKFQAGDGDQAEPDPNPNALRDWETVAGNPNLISIPDTGLQFSQGSKEDSPGVEPGAWTIVAGDPEAKFNILNTWAFTELVPQPSGPAHTVLYMAFVRESPNGNTFLTFELNQRTETWDNDGDPSTVEIPCREDGDILISYEVEPGGQTQPDPVTIHLYEWNETVAGDKGCSAGGTFTDLGVLNDPSDPVQDAQAAINEAAPDGPGDIENFLDTDGDGDFDANDVQEFEAGTFAEAAIDMSAVFNAIGQPCFNFGQMQIHSRASSTITSELKDLLGPIELPVQSCTASGVKFEDLNANGAFDEGEPGLEGWIIWADYDGDGILDADEPSDTTDEDGDYSISDIDGEYTLREMPGPDVDGTWICSYPGEGEDDDGPSGPAADDGHTGLPTPDGGTEQDCGWGPIDPNDELNAVRDFGNYQQATITLIKDLVPDDDPGLFDLFVDPPGDNDDPLADDVSDNGSAMGFFDPGSYDVSELAGTDTSLDDYNSSVHCELNGEDLGSDTSGTSRSDLVVESGDSLECTFTNTRKTGKLEVVKDLQPSNDSGKFNLQIDNVTEAPNVGDGGTTGEVTVNTGTHSVGETAGTATSLGDYVSSIECRDEDGEGDVVTSASGSGPLDVEVAEDDDIVCTITNKRKATVTVIKDARPEDGTDFAFTATGPGLSGFTLDDDADPALSNTKVFSGLGTFGPGSVSEQVPAGWSNTSASCTEGSSEGSTVSFSIDPGDNITCTFVNKKDAKVTIVKDAIPDDEQDFSFSGDFDAFQLDDDGDGTLPSSRTFTVAGDDFGVYQVSETPAGGWTLTDITCTPEGTDGGNTATLDVDPGDNITCKFTNARDTGQLEVVKNVVSDDPKENGKFNLQINGETRKADAQDGDTTGKVALNTGTHTVGETAGTGTSLANYESSIECRDEGGEGDVVESGNGTGPLNVDVTKDSDIVCVITNERILNPAIHVEKRIRNVTLGGAFVKTPPPIDAYVGDTLQYEFTVTNPGDVALEVDINDPRCNAAPVRTQKQGDDELLDPGEAWIYVCSHVVTASDPDPLPNTVKATGTIPGTERTVEDEDSAAADIFHPAIDIDKTGPATATAGDVLPYTLTVKNTGDIPFASDKVVVTDPGCDDQPTLTSKNGDPSPGSLDPGVDTWTYTCSHKTATTDTSFLNVATVTGTDRNGRTATDTDDQPTALGQVLPQPEIVNGTARLRGPSGCVRGPFTATVRGSRIARATFFVDGKRFRQITAPTGEGNRFTVRINPRGRGFGVHRVTARVEFAAASQTATRTLRLSFQRCRKQVVRPRFTG